MSFVRNIRSPIEALICWNTKESSGRVVIAHAGLAEDPNGLEALVRRGAYVAFDHFGMHQYEAELN